MEGELQRRLGKSVRAVRKELGESQEAFAERVGWHRTYYGAVERGQRNLTLRSVERLAEMLHVDPLDLLSEPGTRG